MSAKPIREYHGKDILTRWFQSSKNALSVTLGDAERRVLVTSEMLRTNEGGDFFETITVCHPWLVSEKLIVKPDQLIKRRGKAGLIAIDQTWDQVKEWILLRMGRKQTVEGVAGILEAFIVEPFVVHQQKEEHYLCIQVDKTASNPFIENYSCILLAVLAGYVHYSRLPVHNDHM
eukprot:gene15780-18711_t